MASNSAGAVIKFNTAACLLDRETVKHLCEMTARYRVFDFVSFLFLSSVIKFDKICANSTQRSQSPNS